MDNKIISYLTLRKVIGYLGILLSPVLILVWLIVNGSIEQSISAYYLTGMRNIMVSVLVIAGAFLLTYKGYDLKDNIVSSVSGILIVLVALVPLTYPILHGVSAVLFFLSIAYMSYFQFSKDAKHKYIYKICGIVIVISLLLLVILKNVSYSMLILEIIALTSFGISWLTKGKTL